MVTRDQFMDRFIDGRQAIGKFKQVVSELLEMGELSGLPSHEQGSILVSTVYFDQLDDEGVAKELRDHGLILSVHDMEVERAKALHILIGRYRSVLTAHIAVHGNALQFALDSCDGKLADIEDWKKADWKPGAIRAEDGVNLQQVVNHHARGMLIGSLVSYYFETASAYHAENSPGYQSYDETAEEFGYNSGHIRHLAHNDLLITAREKELRKSRVRATSIEQYQEKKPDSERSSPRKPRAKTER